MARSRGGKTSRARHTGMRVPGAHDLGHGAGRERGVGRANRLGTRGWCTRARVSFPRAWASCGATTVCWTGATSVSRGPWGRPRGARSARADSTEWGSRDGDELNHLSLARVFPRPPPPSSLAAPPPRASRLALAPRALAARVSRRSRDMGIQGLHQILAAGGRARSPRRTSSSPHTTQRRCLRRVATCSAVAMRKAC